MRLLLLIVSFMLLAATSFAAEPQSAQPEQAAQPAQAAQPILGIWHTEDNKSQVEIAPCGDKLCGKIIWLRDPLIQDPNEGQVGAPRVDKKNPNEALRTHPVLGLQIVEGFVPSGENKWEGGTVYDPESGHTYKGKMWLASPQRLKMRGFIGISLFGRTTEWTRNYPPTP